jgi:hypothetical protein
VVSFAVFPGKEHTELIGEKAEWLPEPVWRREKFLSFDGNQTPIFRAVACRYTD